MMPVSLIQQINIIFEDEDILVINKPAGLVVNRSQTAKQETVQSWFEANFIAWSELRRDATNWQSLIPDQFDPSYGEPMEIFRIRGGVVHRLDKQTSGVLVLAKNPGSLLHLMLQFKSRQTKKRYLALVHGLLEPRSGTINAPLRRHFRLRKKIAVDATGRQAQTDYQVLRYYQFHLGQLERLSLKPAWQKKLINTSSKFSLVEAKPKTGRMHQIRVHLSHLGHPLVADEQYAGRKRYKLDKLWCPRHFLHASRLDLIHPRSQQHLGFQAPLATDLAQSLEYLQIL